MQINNIFIIVDNNFTNIKKKIIRLAKIIIKNKKHLTSIYFLKFNSAQIKLN